MVSHSLVHFFRASTFENTAAMKAVAAAIAVAGGGLAIAVSPTAIHALDKQQSKLLAKGIRAQWRQIPAAGQPSSFQVFYHPPGLEKQLVEKK